MTKLLPLLAVSALFSASASADLIRVEAGIGAWQTDPEGTMQYDNSEAFDIVDSSGFESTTNPYVWAYIKHPVPILPNLRLEYVDTAFDANTKLDYSYGGQDFSAGASNSLTLTQYDAVMYYNLLDNTFWATLDLGIDLKYIDGNYTISGSINNNTETVNQDFDLVVPLLYGRVRSEILLSNFAVEAIAKAISYSDNTVVDAELKLDYTFSFVPVIQPSIEIGYRYQQMELDSSSLGIDANLDTKFSGVYGGVVARF